MLLKVRYAHYPELTAFISHQAEARDFHCFFHVSDNLGERSIPSDHVAVRVVVQKPTNRCDQAKRIPSRVLLLEKDQ